MFKFATFCTESIGLLLVVLSSSVFFLFFKSLSLYIEDLRDVEN